MFSSSIMLGQSISNNKLKYDNQFRPYIEITVTNDSFSDITSLEFEIVYTWTNIGRNFLTKDPRKNTTRNQIVEITIPEMSKKTITFQMQTIEDYKPYGISLKRVRYKNGKVKQLK